MAIKKRKLGPKPKQESAEAKEREQDTIREVNKALDQPEVRLSRLPFLLGLCTKSLHTRWAAVLQVDLTQLRKLAAVRGLVNNEVGLRIKHRCMLQAQGFRQYDLYQSPSNVNALQIRARVWPLLLGAKQNTESFDDHKVGKHRDSSVVDVDVQRSLWAWTEGLLPS